MKSSLKQQLLDLIRVKGYASLTELHALTHSLGYKESNCERRMREIVGKELVKKDEKKGVIVGYFYVGGMYTPKPAQTPIQGLNLPSGNTYKSHYDNG
jgi:hypothetical protein